MRIAIDLMGGDRAPDNILQGVLSALEEKPIQLVLVGDEGVIKEKLNRLGVRKNIPIFHSSQVVEMGEESTSALKKKRDSSIMMAFKLVSEGEAQGIVSAGSSGATVACGLHTLGSLKGIKRPALVSHFITEASRGVILDIGANIDSDEENLYQFAYMGAAYAKVVLKVDHPKVALLSNGEEDVKGNKTTRMAHSILQKAGNLNYIGFLEGSMLFKGKADVIVCDGFVGNIVLKSSEAIVSAILDKLGYGSDKPETGRRAESDKGVENLVNFIKGFDYAEYGGALLLGLKGLCMVCHGDSSPKAVKNAILQAEKFIDMDFTGKFEAEYGRIVGS